MHTIPKKVYIPTLINTRRQEFRDKHEELAVILRAAMVSTHDKASRRIHNDLLEIITDIYRKFDDTLSEITTEYDAQHRMGNQTTGG